MIWFFTSQSTNFQLRRDGSSWVEPVLSKDKWVLLKDTTQWRRWGLNLKHSITEPLCSYLKRDNYKNRTCVYCYTQVATAACVMLTIWNLISISINKLLEIHSRPLSNWPLIILMNSSFLAISAINGGYSLECVHVYVYPTHCSPNTQQA